MSSPENQHLPQKEVNTATSEEGQHESEGLYLAPPPFQLVASGDTPPVQRSTNEIQDLGNYPQDLWNELQPIFKKRMSQKNRKTILMTLYKYPSSTITDCFKNTEAGQYTEKFLNKLGVDELTSYSREITAAGQALPASVRITMIQKELKKGKFRRYGENDKYKAGLEDETYLIMALFQGLTIADIDPDGANGYDDTLAGIVGKHRSFKSNLASDVAQDNAELDAHEGDEGAFIKARAETNDLVEKAYLSIAFKGRKSGDKNDKTQIKNGAMFYLNNSNSPEEAIEAYEILEALPEAALKEFMNRYGGLFDAIVYDLPDSYRARHDFGLFDGTPDSLTHTASPSGGQAGDKDPGNSQKEGENLVTDLEKIFLLLQPGGTLAEDSADVEARKNNSSDTPYIPTRKQIKVDDALKARIRMSFELLAHAKDFGPAQELIKNHGSHTWLWTDAAMADILLFLLTADAIPGGTNPIPADLRTLAEQCPDPAILAQYGYANGTWGPVPEADYSNAKDFRGGKMVGKGVFKNGDNKHLVGYGLGGDKLKMDDFSLVTLQEQMGGHIMGLEFGQEVDPSLAEEYAEYSQGEGQNPVAGDTPGGALDVDINGYQAMIQANNLPIEAMSFELSDGITTSGPGFIAGLSANIIYDQASKKDIKKDPNAANQVIGTDLDLGKLVLTNFKMIDADGAMAINHIEVSGLKARYNQALGESGPTEGAFGMNMVTTLLTHVFEILFFGMNSTFKAMGHLVPEMADDPGNYTQELVEAMGADPALTVELANLHISNIISESGDVWKDIELGETELSLGGASLKERAQAEIDALQAKETPLTATEAERIKHFEQIIAKETIREDEYKTKIASLEGQIQALPENDPQRLALAGELKKLKRSAALPFDMVTEIEYIDGWSMPEVVKPEDLSQDGAYDNLDVNGLETKAPTSASSSYPVPATKVHMAGNIMAQGYQQDDAVREEMELDHLSGVYQESDLEGPGYDASEVSPEFFLEVFDPEINAKQGDINDSMGFDLNKALPDYARIYLDAEGNNWTMEINVPSIKIGDLPAMDGLAITSTDPTAEHYLELKNAKAVLNIGLNPAKEEGQKAGLTSLHTITLEKLEGSQLVASNAKLSYKSENSKGEIDEIILTNERSVFNAPVFTGLGISFDENLSMDEIDMSNISLIAQATQLNGLTANAYDMLVEASLSTYTAESFHFSMQSDPDGVSYKPGEDETFLQGYDDLKKHEDVMRFGFEGGSGDLSKASFNSKDTPAEGGATKDDDKASGHQNVDAKAKLGSLSGSIETTTFTSADKEGRSKVYESSTTSMKANLPSLTVTSIDIFDPASGTTVKGGTQGGEVILTNVNIDFRLENHADGEGNAVNTIYHVDRLSVDAIEAADVSASMGKTPLSLDKPGYLGGLVIEGYHYDKEVAAANGYPLFPGSFDPGKGIELAAFFFEELTASTFNIQNLSSGKLYFKRSANDKGEDGGGYEYGVDNLTAGSVSQEGDSAVSVNLPGLGANIKGTWLDDNTLTSQVSIPQILEIPNFDFFIKGDAAKGKTDLRIASTGDTPAQLVDMFADVEIKMEKVDGEMKISNVLMKKLKVGQMNLPGIDITQGDNSFSIPPEFGSFINDVVITDLNIDVTNKQVTGGSGETGDAILDVSVDKFSSDAIQSLTTTQTVSTGGASFDINEAGDLEIGLEDGKIFMGMTSFDTQDDPTTKDEEQHIEGFISSLSEAFPGISMGQTKVILEGLFDPKRDKDAPMPWSVLVENLTLEELELAIHELGDQATPLAEYLSTITLSGGIDGTFYLADEGDAYVLSTRKNMEGEASDELSSLVIAEAGFESDNFLQLMNGISGPPDPKAPIEEAPDYQIDGFDPDDVMEEYKKNNPGVDPSKDGLKMDRSFDFLNALEPSDGDDGTVTLTFWGQTATLPIESVQAPDGSIQQGYVDLNAFLSEIEGPVYLLAKDIIEDSTDGWFGSNTAALGQWMMGADLDNNGKYYLEVANFNVVTLHPLPDMEHGILYDDDRSLIRLSDLMTYAPHGIAPSEEPAGEGAEAYMKAFETLDTMFNGRSMSVSLNNVKLDPEKMEHAGMLEGLVSDEENNPLSLSMTLGVDMGNQAGLNNRTHKKHYHGGPDDTFTGETWNKNGLDMDIGPLYIPGIDTSKNGMDILSGPMKADKINFKLDDYRMKKAHGEVQNLSMEGLELRIPKSRAKDIKKKKEIDPIFLHTDAEKAAEKAEIDRKFKEAVEESRNPRGPKW